MEKLRNTLFRATKHFTVASTAPIWVAICVHQRWDILAVTWSVLGLALAGKAGYNYAQDVKTKETSGLLQETNEGYDAKNRIAATVATMNPSDPLKRPGG